MKGASEAIKILLLSCLCGLVVAAAWGGTDYWAKALLLAVTGAVVGFLPRAPRGDAPPLTTSGVLARIIFFGGLFGLTLARAWEVPTYWQRALWAALAGMLLGTLSLALRRCNGTGGR